MKIISLSIQGFRSFSSPQAVNFDNAPGLYFITGRNESEPELAANGAGKSSVMEALFWCLYGKTSRGLRAGNVQCWIQNSPPCEVEIQFDIEANQYKLCRRWNPNQLMLISNQGQPKPIDQTELENVIGIGPEAFLQSVYFSQFAPAFVDLAPANRLLMLTDVLRLEKWTEASEAANSKAKACEVKINVLVQRITRLEGQLEQLNTQDWTAHISEWQTQQESKINQHNNNLTQFKTRKQNAANSVRHLTRLLGLDEDMITEVTQKQSSARIQLKQYEPKLELLRKDIASFKARIGLLSQQITNISELDGKQCPRCGQLVSAEHAEKEANILSKELDEIQNQNLPPLQAELDKLLMDKNLKQQEEQKIQKELLEATSAMSTTRAKLQEANSNLKSIDLLIGQTKKQLDQFSSENNPYLQEQEKTESEREKLIAELEPLKKQIGKEESQLQGYSFWSLGFKNLRLFVIEQVVYQLEIEVNNTLVQLGLPTWSVHFSIEQETKSGTIKRGFGITISSPHSGVDSVPFEVWSGGESQRLRLAISMGMSNLIAGQLAVDSNIEFWDEPSTWLSDSGIEEMIGALSQRAASLGKSIWLADHRSLNYGGFTGSLMVVKTALGSCINTESINHNTTYSQQNTTLQNTMNLAKKLPR